MYTFLIIIGITERLLVKERCMTQGVAQGPCSIRGIKEMHEDPVLNRKMHNDFVLYKNIKEMHEDSVLNRKMHNDPVLPGRNLFWRRLNFHQKLSINVQF